MQIDATLLRLAPDGRDSLILVGLVNDFRNDLRPLLDQTGVGRWEFGAVDGVGRGIFDQQRQQCEDTANEERHDDQVYHQKYQQTSPHGGYRNAHG